MGSQKTHRPSFLVKIEDDDDFTRELRMPTDFIKHFNGMVPVESILRTSSSGRCWIIKVKSEEENLFFRKGWSAFVEDHSLELGDSLVLKYKGNSQFYVKIYGKNGCEKELHSAQAKGKFTKSHMEVEHEYYEVNMEKDSVGSDKNICGSDKCVKPKRSAAVNNERTETPAEAACSIKEECPYFILSWKQEMKYQAKIPTKFLREVGEELFDTIALEDTVGRIWSIGLRKLADGGVWFQKDWEEFLENQFIHDQHFLYFRYIGSSQFYVFTLANISASEMMHLDDSVHHEEPNLNKRCQSKEENIKKSAYGTKSNCNKRRVSPSSEERPNSRYKKKRSGDEQGKARERSCLGESKQATKQGSEESSPCRGGNERIQSNGHESVDVEQQEASSNEPPADLDESNEEKQTSEEGSPSQGNEEIGSNEHEWIDVDSDESTPVAKNISYSLSVRTGGYKSAVQVDRTFKSDHPFFTVFIRETYLSKGYLYIPDRFAKEHLVKSTMTVKLLRGSKTWSVGCYFNNAGAKLSCGWSSFSREIGLGEGDVCVFELINKNVATMKVSIFRAIEDVLTLI